MKILTNDSHLFHARLTEDELKVLVSLLELYPVVPTGYHLFSLGQRVDEDQLLLDDSLSDLQRESRALLQRFIHSDDFVTRDNMGISLKIPAAQLDWFLQILNDIRVGLWIRLGCPDEKSMDNLRHAQETTPEAWNMELCGFMISLLLNHE